MTSHNGPHGSAGLRFTPSHESHVMTPSASPQRRLDRGRRPGSPDGPAADADLTARYQAGDRAALDELITRYRRFARARARAYFVAGGDADDVEQEALIILVKAAGDHRSTDGPFRPFADLCITRAMVSAIRRANRQKHRLLNDAVSLSAIP